MTDSPSTRSAGSPGNPDLSREAVPGQSVALAPGQLQLRPARRGKPPAHLADLTLAERVAAVAEVGLPGCRAKQLAVHYCGPFTTSAEGMTDLPAGRRDALTERFFPTLLTPVSVQAADNGATQKFLWKLFDGPMVESVLMRYSDRVTLCISSEAGCGMNCPFCATGQRSEERRVGKERRTTSATHH